MSIIKVIDGEKRVVANKSITDHSQLTGREAYGAHPISAIRKLPEKLYELKEKDIELEAMISAHDSEVDAEVQRIDQATNQLTNKVAEIINSANNIKLEEDSEHKGQLKFTDYNGSSINVQGGFLPDDITLQLTENDTFELKNKPDEETIITDNGKIYATAIKDNGNTLTATEYKTFKESTNSTIQSTINDLDLLRQETVAADEVHDLEITKLKHLTAGMGGYLDSYDFGKANPTQEELFAYALQQTNAEKNEDIFTGTRVINIKNDHTWVLVNTPDTDPVILEWIDLGDIQPIDVATEDTYGLVRSSNEDLAGKVSLDGQVTINGLQERLNTINNDINTIESTYATKEYVRTNGGKIDSISLNGVAQTIDANKNVNIQLDLSAIETEVQTVQQDLNTLQNKMEMALEITDLTEE